MGNAFVQKVTASGITLDTGKFLAAISGMFLFIVCITVFQDLLDSLGRGYAFYLSESLLFKTIWLLFIPILEIVYKRLNHKSLDTFQKTTLFIIIPIVVHLMVLPLISFLFSVLFYNGRYDLYKFFSYTLSNDLYKLVMIYGGFVLGFKYFTKSPQNDTIPLRKLKPTNIVINNGKENTVVNIEDIVQITSATPYVFIHLKNRKYLHSETLKSISNQLDNNIFVRVHKTTIVNIKMVNSFKSRLNGDYDLQLMDGGTVRLSRTYASNFKKQFDSAHRLQNKLKESNY